MQLVGVSIPRSGHHHLERLLAAVLSDTFSYCEFYGPVGCCRAIPCERNTTLLRLQKNHDFELAVPTDLTNCLYVIQHREPVAAAVSDREFYARVEGAAVGSRRDDHEVWLARKAAHFVGFWRRWLSTPPHNSVVIDYADLTTNPIEVINRLLAAAGVSITESTLRTAVDRLANVGDFGVADGFTPLPLDQRHGFDGALLSLYESLLLHELPNRATSRVLPPVACNSDSILEIAYAAATAELEGDAERTLAAVEHGLTVAPTHPLLLHWRGRLAWRAGDLSVGRHYCDEAVAHFPSHPLLRIDAAQISYAQSDFASARVQLEALRDLRELNAGHEVLLAMVITGLGDHDAALAQIDRARAARPNEPAHWAYLVHAAGACGEPQLGRNIADEALAVWPSQAEIVASVLALPALS